jgi:6-phosphogluconolactonase (cycloisomerase 2 family)
MGMTNSRFMRVAVVAAAAASVVAGGAAASVGGAPSRGVVGRLYVNDNTAGVNTVAGFDRHADGSLTPLPGSPFAVGGAGPGHGVASQGSLQQSADGRYLLAVDAGSNEISVLRIKPHGSLQIADVTSSDGGNPVSIAVSGNLVYVANADPSSPNYTGFRLDAGGHLRPIPGSTVPLPAGSQPGDVLFSGDGTRLVGTRVGTSLIDSFTVASNGLLTPAPGSPFLHQPGVYGQFGSEFSPTDPAQLFVSNAHNAANGPAPGSVSAYTDSADGTLNPIGSSPFANSGVASCWVEISHDGRFLFTVDTASSSIASYSIRRDGTLTPLADTPIRSGAGAEDTRLAPDGSTLWVVNAGGDTVNGFSVEGGSLTELPSSPTPGPAGATPTGIVLT